MQIPEGEYRVGTDDDYYVRTNVWSAPGCHGAACGAILHIKDGKFGFTFVAKYDYKDTKLDELIKKITNGNGTDIKSNHVDNWTNVGVVVKTVNGQTYIAVSVAIDVS